MTGIKTKISRVAKSIQIDNLVACEMNQNAIKYNAFFYIRGYVSELHTAIFILIKRLYNSI